MHMVRFTKKDQFPLKNPQKLEFSDSPGDVGNPGIKLLGDGPPYRVYHSELSYAPLPVTIWSGSPKKVQFSLKNAQKLVFSGSPGEFGNPGEKLWLRNESPHQEENVKPSDTPLPQCIWSDSPKSPIFPQNSQKFEFSGSPGEVGNPGKKLLGDVPPYQVCHFDLSYAPLPLMMWSGSPKKF